MKQIIFLTIYFLFLSYQNEQILANECTSSSISPRIIGGEDADIVLHSYTLALRNRGDIFCTAFAVSKEDVFTAAHCFDDLEYPYPDVTVHSHSVTRNNLGTVHYIDQITPHPFYTKDHKFALVHDIAHILLNENTQIEISPTQLVLQLPTEEFQNYRRALMTGWGCATIRGDIAAERLQMLEMEIARYQECQDNMPKGTKLFKEHLCAITHAGHGCAVGDSGGPLVMGNVVIGIHSWCQKDKRATGIPEVFTNIYQERQFLKSVMRVYPGETPYGTPEASPTSSPTPSSSPDPDNRGKRIRTHSLKPKKSSWLRRLTCTSVNIKD